MFDNQSEYCVHTVVGYFHFSMVTTTLSGNSVVVVAEIHCEKFSFKTIHQICVVGCQISISLRQNRLPARAQPVPQDQQSDTISVCLGFLCIL